MVKPTTATEILEERIEVPCYLCGKGKIIIRAGNIGLVHKLPISHGVEVHLRNHLLRETKKFFEDLSL